VDNLVVLSIAFPVSSPAPQDLGKPRHLAVGAGGVPTGVSTAVHYFLAIEAFTTKVVVEL